MIREACAESLDPGNRYFPRRLYPAVLRCTAEMRAAGIPPQRIDNSKQFNVPYVYCISATVALTSIGGIGERAKGWGARAGRSESKRRAECRDRSVILLDSARSPVTFECSLDFTSRRRERREEEEHREGEKTRTSISFAFPVRAAGRVPRSPPTRLSAQLRLVSRAPPASSKRVFPANSRGVRPRCAHVRPGNEGRRRNG